MTPFPHPLPTALPSRAERDAWLLTLPTPTAPADLAQTLLLWQDVLDRPDFNPDPPGLHLLTQVIRKSGNSSAMFPEPVVLPGATHPQEAHLWEWIAARLIAQGASPLAGLDTSGTDRIPLEQGGRDDRCALSALLNSNGTALKALVWAHPALSGTVLDRLRWYGAPLLHGAVRQDDLPSVQALIAKGVTLDAWDEYGGAALGQARSAAMVALLLDAGATVNPHSLNSAARPLTQMWTREKRTLGQIKAMAQVLDQRGLHDEAAKVEHWFGLAFQGRVGPWPKAAHQVTDPKGNTPPRNLLDQALLGILTGTPQAHALVRLLREGDWTPAQWLRVAWVIVGTDERNKSSLSDVPTLPADGLRQVRERVAEQRFTALDLKQGFADFQAWLRPRVSPSKCMEIYGSLLYMADTQGLDKTLGAPNDRDFVLPLVMTAAAAMVREDPDLKVPYPIRTQLQNRWTRGLAFTADEALLSATVFAEIGSFWAGYIASGRVFQGQSIPAVTPAMEALWAAPLKVGSPWPDWIQEGPFTTWLDKVAQRSPAAARPFQALYARLRAEHIVTQAPPVPPSPVRRPSMRRS
jgi:hypothetical protein